MVGSIVAEAMRAEDVAAGKAEVLPEELDLGEVPEEAMAMGLPGAGNGFGGAVERSGRREISLGRNIHSTCFAVTEPDADDEETGDREAYMASVLARYRRSLVEKTRHHLGISPSHSPPLSPWAGRTSHMSLLST